MKRLLSVLLCFVLIFALAACGLSDSPSKESGSSENNTSVSKDDTFGLNDTAVFKTLKFTATEIKESEGNGFFTPEQGNTFVGVKFTIENVSEEEQSVSSMLLFEAYANDIKCDYSINAACAFDEGTLDGSITPGKKLVGWYALEVPENWENIEIDVKADWLSDKSAKFVFTK